MNAKVKVHDSGAVSVSVASLLKSKSVRENMLKTAKAAAEDIATVAKQAAKKAA